MFCINLAALFPAVHMSWFVPCGTVISKFVPFIVYVPSPIGLMNVHTGFIVHVLKSSDTIFVLMLAVLNISSSVLKFLFWLFDIIL